MISGLQSMEPTVSKDRRTSAKQAVEWSKVNVIFPLKLRVCIFVLSGRNFLCREKGRQVRHLHTFEPADMDGISAHVYVYATNMVEQQRDGTSNTAPAAWVTRLLAGVVDRDRKKELQ